MSRPTSTTDRALLALLATAAKHYGDGMTASEIGAELWPQRRGHVVSSNGGGDYAAQMLLDRMRKAHLVHVQPGSITSVWELTTEGRRQAIEASQESTDVGTR